MGLGLFRALGDVSLDGLVNDGGEAFAPSARGQLKKFSSMLVANLDRRSHNNNLACMLAERN